MATVCIENFEVKIFMNWKGLQACFRISSAKVEKLVPYSF